jgi:chitinase
MKKFICASVLAASIIGVASADVSSTPLLAGYIDNSATGSLSKVNIKTVAEDGYNTVIFSFIKIDGTSVSFADGTQDSMTEMSQEAKDNNMKTLMSVGGQNNTFNPGNLSEEECNQLATNIVNFIKSNGFDGIDFDLEVQTSPTLIKSLVSYIKNIDKDIIVTAAPQVVSIGDTLVPVTTGTNQDYSEAIQSGLFDYLFLQEYNSTGENDPNFIINAFDDISKLIPEGASTKIVTGQPTAAQAAGQTTLYYPEGSANPLKTEDVAKLMLPELKQISNDNKYGGVMGWSINVDYAPDAYPVPFGEAAPHNPGDFAYFLNQCVLNGSCDKIPDPKPYDKSYDLQITDTSTNTGITVTVGDTYFGYIANNAFDSFDGSTNPSTTSITNKTGLQVKWVTYDGGPSGTCPDQFNFTNNNYNIMINPDTGACAYSHW